MAMVKQPSASLPCHGVFSQHFRYCSLQKIVKPKQVRYAYTFTFPITIAPDLRKKKKKKKKKSMYEEVADLRQASDILRLMDVLNIPPKRQTYAHFLQECNGITQGTALHAQIIKSGFQLGIFLANNLLTMYTKCGKLEDARQVFDKMTRLNKVSWTAMIAAYAENGYAQEALALFRRMQRAGVKPNHITFVSVVQACAFIGDLEQGKQVHTWVVKKGFNHNLYLGSALLYLYCNWGCLEDARKVFDQMPQRDVVSWTAMIAGYSRYDCVEDAFELFGEMQVMGVKPNEFTISSISRACTSLGYIKQGQGFHAFAIKMGLESDVFVGSALVDLYGKYGNLADAWSLLDKISHKDNVVWNAMISGCLQWGCGKQALLLLNMMRLAGLEPEEFIVNGVMNACGNEDLKEIGIYTDTEKSFFRS